MPLAGLEPALPAYERPQTYALDQAATGIGHVYNTPALDSESTKDRPFNYFREQINLIKTRENVSVWRNKIFMSIQFSPER